MSAPPMATIEWFTISDSFSPMSALMGGLALGITCSVRFMLWGKITGISGISSSIVRFPIAPDLPYNGAFTAGLVLMGFFLKGIIPDKFESMESMGLARLVIAGLLVGFGTKLGNGCTSGHGICGNARMSSRSMVATLSFMATGSLTAILAETTKSVTKSVTAPGTPWYMLPPPLPSVGLCAIMGAFFLVMAASNFGEAAAAGLPRQGLELGLGACFGTGLALSGMVQPSKVATFLDFTGEWDPSLMFVMGGALLLSLPFFFMILKAQPCYPTENWNQFKEGVDWRLVAGAALFGVGWGYAGVCPGPALVALGTGQAEAAAFVGAMYAGFLAFSAFDSLLAAAFPAKPAAAKAKKQ